MGSGTTINACARYYVTAATLLSERTTHIALFSLCQTLGFILGPGVMVSSRTALCRIKLSFQIRRRLISRNYCFCFSCQPIVAFTLSRYSQTLQAGMAFMGHKPVPPGGEIVFDMYTSCAWLSAASGLLSLLVFLPGVFRETFIADRELEALKTMADQNQETAGAEQRIMRSVNAMS